MPRATNNRRSSNPSNRVPGKANPNSRGRRARRAIGMAMVILVAGCAGDSREAEIVLPDDPKSHEHHWHFPYADRTVAGFGH